MAAPNEKRRRSEVRRRALSFAEAGVIQTVGKARASAAEAGASGRVRERPPVVTA